MILQLVTLALQSGLDTLNLRTMRWVADYHNIRLNDVGLKRAVILYNSIEK